MGYNFYMIFIDGNIFDLPISIKEELDTQTVRAVSIGYM